MSIADSETRFEHRVPNDVARQRLDRYLTSLSDLSLSRTRIQKLIASGLVLVDSEPQSASYTVQGGELLSVTVTEQPRPSLQAEDIPLDIVFEDKYLAVVNKPAGMVTHPAPGNYSGTLVNALVYHFGKLADSSGSDRPGIVHRLDKNTSGLLVVARTDEAYRLLQQAIQQRTLKRRYHGLIWGHMGQAKGAVELPIARSRRDRKKMAVTGQGGREARTEYRELARYRSFHLLELSLHTGRTHQIRVHLSHLGHPVFGDPEYGGREKKVRGMFAPERPLASEALGLLKRQALHARELAFKHPVTEEELSLVADPPEDFQSVIDLLDRTGR